MGNQLDMVDFPLPCLILGGYCKWEGGRLADQFRSILLHPNTKPIYCRPLQNGGFTEGFKDHPRFSPDFQELNWLELVTASMRHFTFAHFQQFDPHRPVGFRQNFYSHGGWTRLTGSFLATWFPWELPSVRAAKAAWWNLITWNDGGAQKWGLRRTHFDGWSQSQILAASPLPPFHLRKEATG